jgi:hypothetical protein
MQFGVPQFTDVEDKLVAGMTFKQFGIIFGAGVMVFVIFTLTSSVAATIVAGLFIGMPALIIAIARINGRPLYSMFGSMLRFMFGPKLYIFHKQAKTLPSDRLEKAEVHEEQPARLSKQAAVVRLKQLNYVLQQQAIEEQQLLNRVADVRKK